MKTVNLHAATPHVSRLVDEAVDGQDVVPHTRRRRVRANRSIPISRPIRWVENPKDYSELTKREVGFRRRYAV
jgi:hypothetical protein